MKKEKQPEKRTVAKKSPKILKNKVSPLIKRGRPKLVTEKSPVPSKRKLNQCQIMRLSRNKQDSLVCAHYYESSTVTNLMLYDKTSQDLPNDDVNEFINENVVTPGQLIQFLGVSYWNFLVLLHLMIQSNTLCIQDALDAQNKEKLLTQQVERGFLFGLCALRRNQDHLLEQQWLSLSMRQIMSLFIISVMLQGVGQIKNFQFQIDYHSKFADLEALAESIFYEVVGNILTTINLSTEEEVSEKLSTEKEVSEKLSTEKEVSEKLSTEKVSKKLFTRKVFDYLIAKNQEISEIVKQQMLLFQRERNPANVNQCVFPLLTMENILENVGANELVFIQSFPHEDYFDFFQESSRYLPPPRSYDLNKYMEAIKIHNEGIVRNISKQKAKKLYFYERTQQEKRDRRQETRRNTYLKNQNLNKSILSQRLEMLEIKQQTVQDLSSSQREQMRYLNSFLSFPQIDTYLIDKNKVNPEVVKKMKFPGVANHEIKHQNREIDELISQLIQDQNCIAESVANLIYHGMVAYKIHLGPQN